MPLLTVMPRCGTALPIAGLAGDGQTPPGGTLVTIWAMSVNLVTDHPKLTLIPLLLCVTIADELTELQTTNSITFAFLKWNKPQPLRV